MHTFAEHTASINCMTKINDTIWAGSDDGTISIWDLRVCHSNNINTSCCNHTDHLLHLLHLLLQQKFCLGKKVKATKIGYVALVGKYVWCCNMQNKFSLQIRKPGSVRDFSYAPPSISRHCHPYLACSHLFRVCHV